MTYDEIKTAWDVQADENNQWDSLSEYKKVEWALILVIYQPQHVASYVTGCSTPHACKECLQLAN